MKKNVLKNSYSAFHFNHLLTQVPKSLYFIHCSKSAKIFTHNCLDLFVTEQFVSKNPNSVWFWFKSVLIDEFKFFFKAMKNLFFMWFEKMCHCLPCGQISFLYLDIPNNVSLELKNLRKNVSSPQAIFLMG